MRSDINCIYCIISFYIKLGGVEKEILDNTDILGCEFKSVFQKVRPKDSAY